MDYKVFYSWQSDLPNATNRGFIGDALDKAVKSISDDASNSFKPVTDSDTRGEPGSPEILATIMKKIDESHAFVCDLSIISPKRSKKPTPNPNVMLELGYALKSLGADQIILLFNSAYGDIKDLPFDIDKRRVTIYTMPEAAPERAPEKKKLEKILKDALLRIFNKLDTRVEPAEPKVTQAQRLTLLKDYIGDERSAVKLHDLMREVTSDFIEATSDKDFPSNFRPESNEHVKSELLRRLQRYEELIQELLNLTITGCYWGNGTNQQTWVDCLQRIASSADEEKHPSSMWSTTKLYPVLLLLYAGGMAALTHKNYGIFRALMMDVRLVDKNSQIVPSVKVLLSIDEVVPLDYQRKYLLGGTRVYDPPPLSSHLEKLLREPLKEFIPRDDAYQEYFDLFEYLGSMLYAHVNLGDRDCEKGGAWGPPKLFAWRGGFFYESGLAKKLDQEIAKAGSSWPPLQANLFDGSLERLTCIKLAVDAYSSKRTG